ncbi:hypothetical protein ElyMa_001902100 [Elysia marginata]|uniref:Uncharacterized protein n=1 Tax=Elysia marginata TaxID=1093978 RepID=A0AAV4ERQ9_9GAST|nr:hypothetical protein ElyMa_001902100 [Elysia marginata]
MPACPVYCTHQNMHSRHPTEYARLPEALDHLEARNKTKTQPYRASDDFSEYLTLTSLVLRGARKLEGGRDEGS